MSDFCWFDYIGNTNIFNEKQKANKQKKNSSSLLFYKYIDEKKGNRKENEITNRERI